MSKYDLILRSFALGNLKPYIFQGGEMLPTKGGDYPVQQAELSQSDLTSWLGTPIFGEVVLEDENKELKITLDTVLIEINQSKNIVRTEIAGRDGTVKEYVSKGDYYIVLKGGVFSRDPETYPADEISTLIQLLEKEEALNISNDFLQLFGVFSLVVSTYNMGQRPGNMSNQLYEIRGYSDEPIELTIDEETDL